MNKAQILDILAKINKLKDENAELEKKTSYKGADPNAKTEQNRPPTQTLYQVSIACAKGAQQGTQVWSIDRSATRQLWEKPRRCLAISLVVWPSAAHAVLGALHTGKTQQQIGE